MMDRIVIFLALVALLGFSTDRALATDVGIDASMSTIQAGVTTDGIINFDKNGTLTVNANGTGVSTISVAAGKVAEFQFQGSANKIIFKAGAGTITLGAGASLTILGTNAGAGIDFATNNAAATLTVNGSIAGAVNANMLIVGNNTLTVSAAATFAGIVSIGGVSAVLDVDAATTVTTLTLTGALNITPADTIVLTLTNPVSVGANTLTVTGSGAGGAEAINGTITLNNAASQLTTAGADLDDILGNVAIVVSADGATLDVNFNTSPPSVTQNAGAGNLALQVAAGKVLTTTVDVNDNTLTLPETGTVSTIQLDTASGIVDLDAGATATTLSVSAAATVDLDTDLVNFTVTNPFNIGANKLSLVGSGAGGQETFSATVQLNGGAGSELEVTGADVDNITGFTVSATTDGGTLDTNINTAPTAVNMSAAAGDLTLEVATGKTLTTTVDVNDNTLTLSETGTVSTLQLDTATGIVDVDASATATDLTVSAASTVDLDTDLVNFTVTNPFNIGANKLSLVGSGAGGQETFSATVQLNGGAGSELEVTGADVDNITGFTVSATADGGTLDTNINTAPTAVNMSAAAGNLILEVAAGKTLTTTVDVNDNSLTLSETGTVSTIQLDTASGIVDLDASATATNLTVSAASTVDLDTDLVNFTVTNPFNIGANKLSLVGSGAGGQETFSATVQLDGGAGSELEVTGADVDNITGFTVSVTADGGTLDTNINTAPTAVDMSAAAGNLILEVATGKTLTTTVDVNDNILTTSQAGTISTVQLDTAGGTLNVDESHTITIYTLTASATLDVAATKTLTVTNGLQVGANTLTLSTGTGTISRVDATTGRITDNAGVTISDLRALPGAGNTFTFGGTGSATATTLANALTGANNKLNKVGTGTLTIVNGLTNAFDNAAGVLIDIDAGTLVVGSAGSNDDITFDDDADEITVASGAALTTFGSFTVGAAGANVNLDAVAGSTVNLSSTSGAETFTALADDDFNLLGTVNVNGADGDYTISDAFDYKFGSVNINTTGSLINNQPDGEMKFVPDATVMLTGDGTFLANGQASGTRITLDTTTGAGTFTINRGLGNLTVDNVNLSRCIYTSSACGPGGCHISLSGVVFVTGNSGWAGDCCGGGTPPPPPTPPATNIDRAIVDAGGDAIVSTNISSGTSAEVTVSGAGEGETLSVMLAESNTQGTFMGMADGDSGEGNGIPRTLIVDSSLQDGTFSAVIRICVNDADLTGSSLTREQIGLYVFNQAIGEWQLAANNNLGNSQPTDNVGDYGVFQDGFESSDTCAWAVVDGFSTFAAGELTTYTLDASVVWPDSGSVKADPEQTVYSAGLLVNLTATPSPGLEFIDWLINDQDTSTLNPLIIAMDADTVVVAQFDEVDTVVEQFTLSVAVNEADRGTVDVSPEALTYAAGTEVTLTATPASGFTFGGWSGSVRADANTNPLTVTVDSDLDITAFFFPEEAELFTLDVTVDSDIAQSGTVAVSPALESYETEIEITLTATPADGFQFAGWTGDATGTNNPLVITITSNLAIGATFDLDETLGDSENVFDTCGTGAGCGAVGTLTMTLTLMGLASLRRIRRRR